MDCGHVQLDGNGYSIDDIGSMEESLGLMA